MKHCGKFLAGAVLSALFALALAGCSPYGRRVDENYPYDIAAQGGYLGSEAEWLSSQETPETVYRRLYAEAKADGSFTGTYFDFLKQIGLENDATPYIQRAILSAVQITCTFPPQNAAEKTVTSSGAGTILRLDKEAGDADILTNYHVLYSSGKGKLSDSIVVHLYGSTKTSGSIAATYLGGSMMQDLALIRIKGSDVLRESAACAATIGDSDSVLVGESVYAIGNPLNEALSVTGGIVSVEEEWLSLKAADETKIMTLPEMRIDAAVNHGNSGGGLYNAAGEFIGVVNARDNREDVSGFGYAIPSDFAVAVAQSILDNGGTCLALNDGLNLKVAESKAVYDEALGRTHIVEKLYVDSFTVGAGSRAHIARSDTLISGCYLRAGKRTAETVFNRLGDWSEFLYRARLGDTLELVVSREGKQETLTLELDTPTYFTEIK